MTSDPAQTTPNNDRDRALIDAILLDPADFVKVAIADVDGVLRGKYIDKRKLFAGADVQSGLARPGFGFCNVVFGWDSGDVCYDNAAYTGWQSGYPDAQVRVDLSTHRTIPWEEGRHFFLGEFVTDDEEPLGVCPRQTLRRVIARGAEQGFDAAFGMEFEWFNFAETSASVHGKDFRRLEPLTPGMFGYSVLRSTQNQAFFDALLRELREFDVPLEGLHTETGPGVFEAAILYSDALEAADRAALFKTSTKEIASRFGIMASFMARWNTDLPGCSGHAHQSIWNAERTHNLFHAEDAEQSMSDLFRSYIAGQLALLPELLPMLAPNVNSYKRLVDGFWAPTTTTRGIDNRTVALRVITGSPKSTRLETRVPGSDVNPYLAVAACLGSGLWGIERGLTLDRAPTSGSGYSEGSGERLPRTLHDATERFAASSAARELFGDQFVDHFAATREWEWRQYRDAVTDWERRRYFEII